MKRVIGIGGIFFKSKDPAALREWYRSHLGLDIQDWGGAIFQCPQEAAESTQKETTIWNIFPADTEYFAPSSSSFMINYRVSDLDALIDSLRAEKCAVDERIEDSEFGKFGWVMDPEGNRIELWEPPPERFPG